MRRIFPDYTYGDGPRGTCWWDASAAATQWPTLRGDLRVDVAIIGGGFTGINAALRLAEAGVSVAVFEANTPGWGASGRNGGFCCLGGGAINNDQLERGFGSDGRKQFRLAEKAAVNHVGNLLTRFAIDADRHSEGETQLAHHPKDACGFDASQRRIEEDYGVKASILTHEALAPAGMVGPFYGAMTVPIGFGLNPAKYFSGIAEAARQAGAQLFANTEISKISADRVGLCLTTNTGQITADRVIVATNGYSSEDLPDWLTGRYLPTQSSVLVTRPLRQDELESQGWTSLQMCYDTRNLLHYFRLMPDNRMLFGMRGGLLSSPSSESVALRRVRRDFEAFFPAWSNVDTPFAWSGMVCLTPSLTPYVGPIPNLPGAYAAFGYHGNGVAMGSYAGHLVAGDVLGEDPDIVPEAMRNGTVRFPLGRFRRILLPVAYSALRIGDMRLGAG